MFRLAVLLSLVAPSVLIAGPDTSRPNVILMMADDMGMGDTSAYQNFTGNPDAVQLSTPNMERLAAQGMRFTDAHTTSSRCSPSRYGLLTGRYPWRNRLKHWVLFGVQGDPMIEEDRPTLATLFRDAGYSTAMAGKWHVGLRYRRSDGSPAAGWEDADLTQPLIDGPIDHGFEFAWFTSRSHGSSGPDAGNPGKKNGNGPTQSTGPGHIHNDAIIGATGNGKELATDGPDAYILSELGGRHSDLVISFLDKHLSGNERAENPFFLYYPSQSNHSPYTPDVEIEDKPSRGAARTKSGEPMDLRHDFIHENDLILGRMIDWLERNDDPRNPGSKFIENTIIIFTSDNGAEKDSDIATGPFRSHKGSCYEGGHRVPFLISWPAGKIGDGDASTPGLSNPTPVSHVDVFATFAGILGQPLPDLTAGEKGAEDSLSQLEVWRGDTTLRTAPLFFHDHKESKPDPAAAAMRVDDPVIAGETARGQWKIIYSPGLLRAGKAVPVELYELRSDQREENNRISEVELQPLVNHLNEMATVHRNIGGHRLAKLKASDTAIFELSGPDADSEGDSMVLNSKEIAMTIRSSDGPFHTNSNGIGISSGKLKQVEGGENLVLTFDQDVIVQHLAVVAGNGTCGGFYQVGDDAPLAIYCVDGDIDDKDQSGVLSDIGVLKTGETLTLSSAPLYGSETPGQWRLRTVSVMPLK